MIDKRKIRKKERDKYGKQYFENYYWIEDFPDKKHYKKFSYNDPTHEKRFSFIAGLLTKYFKFETFLDAGCGMGLLLRKLLKKKILVRGVEISKYALKHYLSDLAGQKIVFQAGLERLPFSNSEFDLVFCSDVMEHIPIFDVRNSIRELIRVTKKYLVLTINIDHPYKYHPTILSRETWERLFINEGEIYQLRKLQKAIQKECQKRYNEYDFFIFKKK